MTRRSVAARKSVAAHRPDNLADQIYAALKDDIFEFRLLPGDRFTESKVAIRYGASRTPVRQALYRLQREGFVDVLFRSGWQVRPIDFAGLEALYDVRIILEQAAIGLVQERSDDDLRSELQDLVSLWMVPPEARQSDERIVARLDEDFHFRLVSLAGNPELARIHQDITERIRIIRRLDFTQEARIAATYDEHASVLRAILDRRTSDAAAQMIIHIRQSQIEVRNITLSKLEAARKRPRSDHGAMKEGHGRQLSHAGRVG